MKLMFHTMAWEDYLYWQRTDKQMLKRINQLVEDALRHPFAGIGKPEPLKHHFAGCWSRRINQQHRIVYTVIDDMLVIMQCRYHYE